MDRPIIQVPPDSEDVVTGNARLRRGLWDELDLIAQHETEIWARAGKKTKLSRNEIIVRFLDRASEEYWADKAESEKPGATSQPPE